ncbi:MAG: outer membrane protein, partial [Hyphomicrobiaceae bacterium]
PGIVSYEAQPDYAVLGQLQLGYSMGRWLPYVTGGFGFAEVTGKTLNVNSANVVQVGASQEKTNTHSLWSIGAGIDYAIGSNLVAGLWYLYVDSSDEDYTMPWNAGAGISNAMGLDSHNVGISLTYRFCGALGNC